MFKIVAKEKLTPVITMLKVEAPGIARKVQPGQFVVVRVDEVGERFPISLADWDREKGNITLVIMEVGTSTRKLTCLSEGDYILNLAGPLGLPAHIENFGRVVCAGGCYGIGAILPGGVTRFACVDGPEFDGHEVDWELLAARRQSYIEEEINSLEWWESQRWCMTRTMSAETKGGGKTEAED